LALAATVAASAAIILAPPAFAKSGDLPVGNGNTPITKINGLILAIQQTPIDHQLQTHLLDDLFQAKHLLHRGLPHHPFAACVPLADAEFMIEINTGFPQPPLIAPWFSRQWLNGLDETMFEIGCFILR
jgi:hypothetical protein